MQLQCKEATNITPHPRGVHSAVCVDVQDLGLVRTVYNGHACLVPKVRLVFESEVPNAEGRRHILTRRCSASLHPKSTLYQFISQWRGRPVASGESVDLEKLVGVSCTLVLSHQQTRAGRIYTSVDAVSKPTRKVVPSGQYDRAEARRKLELWKAGVVAHGSWSMANGQKAASGSWLIANGPSGMAKGQKGANGSWPIVNGQVAEGAVEDVGF